MRVKETISIDMEENCKLSCKNSFWQNETNSKADSLLLKIKRKNAERQLKKERFQQERPTRNEEETLENCPITSQHPHNYSEQEERNKIRNEILDRNQKVITEPTLGKLI